MPPEIWQKMLDSILPKPFYKRHPILTTLAAFLLISFFFQLFFPSKEDSQDLSLDEDHLALVSIKGVIYDSQDTLKWIHTLLHTDNIKGVLLRVDSPGGSAAASQELFAAINALAKVKPVCVSMGQTAASGGLMVSMAGERIFANASTITGSIGVRMDIPQVKALADKIGIAQETLVTGPYKDAGSSLRPLSDKDRAYLQGILEDLHTQFITIIADARNLPMEKVRELANGQIYTGQKAQSLGLIDDLGTQEDAHAWLAHKTGVAVTKKLVTKPKRFPWYEDFLTSQSHALVQSLRESLDFLGFAPIVRYQ